ncbi:MAG: glycosyltransferase family 39 protein [Acidobacteriota bacterium]|nr:glycosyltransferase family 39 protein [Blastocatellia bacterium]MDW8412351.1 glycosyltransferase family 39 protein [Acidobacteriota bacterium]
MSRRELFILVLVLAVGVLLRVYRLDAYGLGEDETHKLIATTLYRQGDISANAEHPMLMKVVCTLFVTVFERLGIASAEVALRLPNALVGALTGLVIYVFARRLFDEKVAMLSAAIWSIAMPALMINRIAKEDTFLVFFAWAGYYLFHIAKQVQIEPKKSRFYAASGASFGLMIASKYFPHYMGLNFLYYHLIGPNSWNSKISARHLFLFFSVLIFVLLLFNPVLLKLDTFSYMSAYFRELKQTHQGLWMMGKLYHNEASGIAGTTPVYFYLLALAIKMQLPLVLALLLGIVELFRRSDDEAFFIKMLFLLWLIPFSLFPSKWLRYMLSLMPVVAVIAAVGMTKLIQWFGRAGKVLAGVLLTSALFSAIAAAPFYSLYVNPLAASQVGYFFPHDEFYDLGLKEAVEAIAKEAAAGATVVCEAPKTAKYYAQVYGRPDINIVVGSSRSFCLPAKGDVYVIVQDGRRYFENITFLDSIEKQYRPVMQIQACGATALRIYHLGSQAGDREQIVKLK